MRCSPLGRKAGGSCGPQGHESAAICAVPAPSYARATEGPPGMDFLEIVRRAYELSRTRAQDPRELPAATIEADPAAGLGRLLRNV